MSQPTHFTIKYPNMKKTELLILGTSLIITSLISTVFGFAGSSIIGTFWSWFWLSNAVQLILFVSINSILLQRDRAITEQLNVQAFEQFSKFSIKLVCSYCQQTNVTPIQLNQKNTFKCESCNQVNGVFMQFTATPLTTPVDSIKHNLNSAESIEIAPINI
jgi:hypothetical protein